MRYKNWKMYYSMSPSGATGWFEPLETYHWTIVANIKRDPFEQTVGFGESKSAMGLGGALAAPSTAYLYDWNMLPIGQLLWLKELASYRAFPPLQAPETYNLTQIENAMKGEGHGVHHPME